MNKPPLLLLLILAIPLALLPSCTSTDTTTSTARISKHPSGSISHVVVCYLKNHGNVSERQKLIDATRDLRSIPGVEDIEIGYALPSTRPVVVSDFDVALVITFRDATALQAYQTHPTHQQAVKQVLEPLVGKLIIYDIVNQ